jgi:hypothetical protein
MTNELDWIVDVSVPRLQELADPFRDHPWQCGRVSESHVRRNLAKGQLQSRPVSSRASQYVHAGRIAYFMSVGWEDPLDIDVGLGGTRSIHNWIVQGGTRSIHNWIVQDGNHRLAAAILLGKPTIRASISGSVEDACSMLNITYP